MDKWVDLKRVLRQVAEPSLLDVQEVGARLESAFRMGEIKTRAYLLGGQDTTRQRLSLKCEGELSYIPAELWTNTRVNWGMLDSEDYPYAFIIEPSQSGELYIARAVEASRDDVLGFLRDQQASGTEQSPQLSPTPLGNCSDMTIWRREQDPQARFPVPIVISGRCYYDEDEFSAWLSSRPRKCQRGDAGP
jgi:hypothetical protein